MIRKLKYEIAFVYFSIYLYQIPILKTLNVVGLKKSFEWYSITDDLF